MLKDIKSQNILRLVVGMFGQNTSWKPLVVLSSVTEFAYIGVTRGKINIFNDFVNRVRNNSKMNHNHYSRTS